MTALPKRRIWAALPFLVLVAVAAIFAVAVRNGTPERPSALVGRQAPALDLPPIPGAAGPGLKRADLIGHRTIVNFWASWCAPCREEHPVLMAIAKAGGTPIYGVAYKDDAVDARSFLANLGDPFARVGFDGDGRAAIDWGVSGVPETFLVAPDGRILDHEEGPLTEQALKRLGIKLN